MIGDPEILAFEIGDSVDASHVLKEIEIWACGQRVTALDNIGHMSSLAGCSLWDAQKERNLRKHEHYFSGKSVEEIHAFILSLRHPDITFELGDEIWETHQILNWNSNTDSAVAFLIEKDGTTYMTLEFSRVPEISPTEVGVIYVSQTNLAYISSTLESFAAQAAI